MTTIKRFTSALLVFTSFVAATWSAEVPATVTKTNSIDGVDIEYRWNYTIDTESQTATFTGITPRPFNEVSIAAVITDGEHVYPVKKIGKGAFSNERGLISVSLPSTLEEIGDYAFSNCTSLSSIEIPYGIRYIGERVFVNTIITEITLPDSLLDMGGNIAAGAIFDGNINISDSSHFTFSEDGVLYNKDMTKLYSCPTRAEGTIAIPDTVTNICADAFFGCFRLTYLNLPENVNTIGSGAFNVSGIWGDLTASESTAKLNSVFYNGDIPNAADDIYAGTPSTLVSYAFTDSWAGLTTWMGRGVNAINGTNPPVLKYKDTSGITWYYRIIDGSAEIYNEDKSGNPIAAISPMSTTGASYTTKDDSENTIRASALRIPANINGYAVTRIGDHAFDGCSALPYIGIPSSVLSIGDYAFAGCTAVKAIAAADDVPFSATDGTITIPSGVTTIGYHSFEGSKASAVALPYTITALDGNPVAGCDFVGTLEIDASCPKFYSTGNIIYNKKQTTLVAVPANYDSTSLTLLSTVTEIGPEALLECENIDTITLPETLKVINKSAFSGCSSIANLSIPAAVAEIGEKAFEGCTALTRITFVGNAPTASDDIYEGADNVTTYAKASTTGWTTGTWCGRPIVLVAEDEMEGGDEFSVTENGITWYFRGADGIAEIYRDGGTAVSSESPITALTLPTTLAGYLIKGLGEGALSGLRGITSISVPDTYEWIEANAFAGCSSLASVTLPEGISRIGDNAFSNTALAEIQLPSTVKKIGLTPFDGTNLTSLEIPRSTTSLNGNPGAGCINMSQYTVADGNRSFKADGDLLFNYRKTELIACQAYAEEITVPNTVTTISKGAFSCCLDLVKVTYLGNAPTCDADLYDDAPDVVSYASESATGFTSGTWKDRPIILISEGGIIADLYSYDDGTVTWYFRVVDGVAEIYKNGETAVVSDSGETLLSITLPDSLGGYPVYGIGDGALSDLKGITDLTIPERYQWIGDNAFSNCTALASVSLGDGLEEIGATPFVGTHLTELTVPAGVETIDGNPLLGATRGAAITVDASNPYFSSIDGVLYDKAGTTLIACPSTTATVTIPSTVTTIDEDAFNGCLVIEEINIPKSVQTIGERAFANCIVLSKVNYLGDAPSAADSIYEGSASVVSYASENAQNWPTSTWKDRPIVLSSEGGTSTDLFSYDDGTVTWYFRVIDGVAEIYKDGGTAVVSDSEETLLSITLPDSLGGYPVYGLGDGALSDLKGITSVSIPERYQWIGDNVFSNCTALTSVSFGEGLEEIGATPVYGTHVSELSIPVGVKSITGNPLLGATRGASISVDASNPYFAAVDGVLYNKSLTALLAAPATVSAVTIPDTVTTIADDAFNGCLVLNKLAIPTSVTTIGERAFANCSSLTKVSYAGDAPDAADSIYEGSPDIVSYANEDASGWTPTSWKDRPIVLVSDGSAGSEELCYDDGTTTWYFRIINGVAEIWREGPTTAVVNNDGSAITSLTLPDTLGGYVVKGIGECAMANIQGITDISIPQTYAWIGDFAFSNCTSLASCSFNADYVELGTLPFYGTRIATTGSVTDENGVTWDYEVTAAGAQVTKVSGATGDVNIPARLGGYKIGGLNSDALNDCSSITSFATDAKAFMVRDGVLYSADGATLIRVPDASNLGGTCTVVTTKATFEEVNRSGTMSKSAYNAMVSKFKPTTESKVENIKDGTITYSIVYQTTNTTSTSSKKFDVPGDIDLDSIIAGVTEIADYAFKGVGSLSGSSNVSTNSTVAGTPHIESDYLEGTVTYTTTCVTSNYTYNLTLNPKSTVIGENAFAGIDITPVYVEAPVVTLNGTTVDLNTLFLRANSESEIVANGIAVSGSVGKQKITADGGSVDVPAYYTATKTGSTVTLELNDKARPVIAGDSYEDAMIVSGSTVTIRLESSNPDLYYALGSSDTLGGPWTVGEYVKGATSLKTAKPTGDSAFFKVLVTDIRP